MATAILILAVVLFMVVAYLIHGEDIKCWLRSFGEKHYVFAPEKQGWQEIMLVEAKSVQDTRFLVRILRLMGLARFKFLQPKILMLTEAPMLNSSRGDYFWRQEIIAPVGSFSVSGKIGASLADGKIGAFFVDREKNLVTGSFTRAKWPDDWRKEEYFIYFKPSKPSTSPIYLVVFADFSAETKKPIV